MDRKIYIQHKELPYLFCLENPEFGEEPFETICKNGIKFLKNNKIELTNPKVRKCCKINNEENNCSYTFAPDMKIYLEEEIIVEF